MWSESEIHNLKKVVFEELGRFFQNNKTKKACDQAFEKGKNLDFSGFHNDKEAFDHICEK